MSCDTLFVGGSQRTGTTLMNALLCQDPDTNPLIHEATYLRKLLAAYQWARPRLDYKAGPFFSDAQDLDGFHRELVQGLLERLRRRSGHPRVLVLKEPHLTGFFPALARLLDSARFLCMVRDPRDAIASMVQVGRRMPADTSETMIRELFNSGDMVRLGNFFLNMYGAVLGPRSGMPKDRLLWVRYEDLVKDTDQVLAALRRFTGLGLENLHTDLPMDTGELDFREPHAQARPWVTGHFGQAIASSRVGCYGDTLSPDQVRTVEARCQVFMQLFRYLPR